MNNPFSFPHYTNNQKWIMTFSIYGLLSLIIVSLYGIYTIGIQARIGLMPQISFAPLAINIIVWCSYFLFYIIPTYKIYTIPTFFIYQGFSELIFNPLYIINRIPKSLSFSETFGFIRLIIIFGSMSIIGIYIMKNKIQLRFQFPRIRLVFIFWFIGFCSLYLAIGTPVENDFVNNTVSIFNMWYEVFYSFAYLGLFTLWLKPKTQDSFERDNKF